MSTLDISMGVVYKLKQEIIDFIIAQKKVDPSLSCRKLVEIVQKQYQIELSKSSVNALIKESNLSSPVGRKPKFKAPKNFIIPQDKKEALREQVKPFLLEGPGQDQEKKEAFLMPSAPLDAPVPSLPIGTPDAKESALLDEIPVLLNEGGLSVDIPPTEGSSSPLDSVVSETAEDVVPKDSSLQKSEAVLFSVEPDSSFTPPSFPETMAPVIQENDQAMSLLPDPVAEKVLSDDARRVEDIIGQPVSIQRIWGIDDGPLLDGVGGIFLLALLWEMDREGLMGKLVANACGIVSDSPQAVAAEGVFVLDAFNQGISIGEPVVVPSGMAAILGVSEADAVTLFSDIVSKKAADARFRMAVGSAFAAATFEVACLEFTTDKGEKFYMDPLMSTFMREPDLSLCHVPLHFALERLADRFVNNIEPCVFGLSLGHGLSDSFVLSRIATMAGQTDDPVLSVAILSPRGERVAGFTRVPNVTRQIIAVGPLTEEDMRLISFETIQSGQEVFEPILELAGTATGGEVVIDANKSYHAMVYSIKTREERILVISNIDKNIKEKLIQAVIFDKPLNSLEVAINARRAPLEPLSIGISGEIKPLLSISQEYFTYLSNWALARYSPLFNDQQAIDLTQNFYDLKGYVKRHPLGILLKLLIPADHAQAEAVAKAAAVLNVRALKDRRGLRLFVCCEQVSG